MIMSGQTADISPFIEHPFYAWIKFWDNLAKYPDPKEQLSRWLGLAIDIGPAMMAKILKSNGQVLYVSMYHGLTDDECCDNAQVHKWKLFNSLIKSKLGSPLPFHDLQDLDPGITTPHYELYEDDCETHQHVLDVGNDINPEAGNTYDGTEVVEKPQFSIGLISSCPDQFNSCALLKSKIACLHVSFRTYKYFYKLSKSASFSRWLLHPVTQKNQ